MSSIQRVTSYIKLPPEAPLFGNRKLPLDWPSDGDISLKKVCMSYSLDEDDILKDISCEIKAGEKVRQMTYLHFSHRV